MNFQAGKSSGPSFAYTISAFNRILDFSNGLDIYLGFFVFSALRLKEKIPPGRKWLMMEAFVGPASSRSSSVVTFATLGYRQPTCSRFCPAPGQLLHL